jgi:hypothetical protein
MSQSVTADLTFSIHICNHFNHSKIRGNSSPNHRFVFKMLAWYIVGLDPEQSEQLEPHQNFYLEPEPHKKDAAPQFCFKNIKKNLNELYFALRYRVCLTPRLRLCLAVFRIRIHYMRIRIQAFRRMRIRIKFRIRIQA